MRSCPMLLIKLCDTRNVLYLDLKIAKEASLVRLGLGLGFSIHTYGIIVKPN